MCGIIGSIGLVSDCIKAKALSSISHRGPDSSGFFNDGNVFLGHTRLSIQDLSDKASQPMYSDDGRYVIIFNGEIYNHLEIRKQLLSSRTFNSTGDTETVLYAYIKYGEKIFEQLNGIFALAIFDTKTFNIVIVRDQFGVKPLYYYSKNGLFLFGSEIKSFLPFEIDCSINVKSIFNYITFLWSPGENTPLEHVKKLLPGNYLKFNVFEVEDVESFPYYRFSFPERINGNSEKKIIDELEMHLLKAIDRQLLSDVPVGFFLSGGLDSSLLVAMARKLHPNMNIKCYTIDVGEKNATSEGFVDDLHYAKKVANFLNVDLNIVQNDVSMFELFDQMVWSLDEPQADAAPLNVLKIASLARNQGIKVLIGGTAGDDIFSGYRRHITLNFEKQIKYFPKFFVNLVKLFSDSLSSKRPVFRRFKKLIANIHKEPRRRQLGYFTWLSENTTHSLFSEQWKVILENHNPFEYFYKLENDLPVDACDLDRMLYWELKTFLVDHNLNYTDKLGMAVGVEVRVPFLDLDLVRFAHAIPASLKMKGKETKYILKKVAERYLPKEVIYRPKTGFGAPVRKWITSDLEPLINERLSPERLRKRGIFNPETVWGIISANKNGKIDASYSILSLLAIESWFKQFIDEK